METVSGEDCEPALIHDHLFWEKNVLEMLQNTNSAMIRRVQVICNAMISTLNQDALMIYSANSVFAVKPISNMWVSNQL